MTIAYIRKLGGTWSLILSEESQKLWLYATRCHTVYLVNVEISIEDILCRDKAFSLGENVEPKSCDSLVGSQTDPKVS